MSSVHYSYGHTRDSTVRLIILPGDPVQYCANLHQSDVIVVLIELNISALSDLQTPRQQMSQFWSEDFAAHILQISSFRTAEDPVSDLILCVRCTYFDAILDASYVLGLVSFFFRGVHNLIQHDAGQQQG